MEVEKQLFRLPGESTVPGWSSVTLEGKNGQPDVRIWVEATNPKPEPIIEPQQLNIDPGQLSFIIGEVK